MTNSRSSPRRDYRDASERATAAFLWFSIASSTLINAGTVYRFSETPWDRGALFLEIVGFVALMSGLFGYMLSRRLKEGPKTKGAMPYLKYLGTFSAAMALAWSLHVYGMVYAMFGIPPTTSLLLFFGPAWLLFLLDLPTKKTVRTWTGRGSSEG